jgi:hypothetical protein
LTFSTLLTVPDRDEAKARDAGKAVDDVVFRDKDRVVTEAQETDGARKQIGL